MGYLMLLCSKLYPAAELKDNFLRAMQKWYRSRPSCSPGEQSTGGLSVPTWRVPCCRGAVHKLYHLTPSPCLLSWCEKRRERMNLQGRQRMISAWLWVRERVRGGRGGRLYSQEANANRKSLYLLMFLFSQRQRR